MMLQKAKATIASHVLNYSGVRSQKKFIVIESDDWGSIRMPSKDVYEYLLKKGIQVDKCPYNRYDCLETGDDLENLFHVLLKFKDITGNHPIVTANTIMANPDFGKIRECDFLEYHYELATDTLKRYPNRDHTFSLWKKGLSLGIFYPQLHGREHVNVPRWMDGLRRRLPETSLCFDAGLFGLSTTITREERSSYLAALDYDKQDDIVFGQSVIADAASLFERTFGYRSKSFIAPNYVWSSSLENTLNDYGVKYIQGLKRQTLPTAEGGRFVNHSVGDRNRLGQTYLVRNCVFEPSIFSGRDNVEACLAQISTAFFWRKPAIISSHRLNFCGGIDPENSYRNLKALEHLLDEILRRWPDVEFTSSDKLGEYLYDN